ncbi:hypothetical protein BD770DRAFT_61054 [Pilaira anomala]|nr:hypothetical protein BD770DRAFT_61054 [Pilaira anomala]
MNCGFHLPIIFYFCSWGISGAPLSFLKKSGKITNNLEEILLTKNSFDLCVVIYLCKASKEKKSHPHLFIWETRSDLFIQWSCKKGVNNKFTPCVMVALIIYPDNRIFSHLRLYRSWYVNAHILSTD